MFVFEIPLTGFISSSGCDCGVSSSRTHWLRLSRPAQSVHSRGSTAIDTVGTGRGSGARDTDSVMDGLTFETMRATVFDSRPCMSLSSAQCDVRWFQNMSCTLNCCAASNRRFIIDITNIK